jgi:hypothetical protein
MKRRAIYLMATGLAVGLLSIASQQAMAKECCYFKVLAPVTPIGDRSDTVTRTVETTTSSSAVIETTTMSSAVVLERTPALLERTCAAKPHHFLSFGVWP